MDVTPDDLQRLEIAARKRDDEISDRVRIVEQWQNTYDVLNAERRAQTEAEFKRVHERLDRIDSHASKIVWLIIAAILAALLNFVLQGGLNIG